MKQTNFLKSFFLLCALIVGSSSVWAAGTSGTINFGNGSGDLNVNDSSVSGDDNQSNTWTVTTAGTTSYTPTADYAQIGSSKKPATSITFTMTLAANQNITAFSAKFGGFGDTAGTVTLKVDNTTVGTGSLNGTADVTVTNSSSTTGKTLTVTVTGISKGVKAYFISYTYEAAKTLDHISVTTPPTKTAYKIGEPVDLTDMVVTATYTDESTENVTSKCTFNPASGATLDSSGGQNIAISYSGKNTSQAITVASVTGLAVKTAPTTVKYRIGDYLDLTGLVLTATYSDEDTKDITDFTASPIDGSALDAAGNVDVTLSYYGQNCTQRVTVGTLSSLTYNSGTFANTTYTEKDFFDPTGLVVTAHYSNSDGLEEVIDDYILTPSTETALSTTNDKVVVSYTWAETEQTVDIPITVNAGAKYTVSFDAGSGAYTGGNITETEYQGGITLPAATIDLDGWVFAGWATASQTSTQNRPTLYLEGDTYYPTANTTLYAVYTLEGIDGTKYQRVTELSEATSASSMIFVDKVNSKVFKYNGSNVTYDTAPTEINGQITPSDGIVWTLDGNNTDGYNVKTTSLETNRYVGFNTPAENTDYANIQTYLSNTLSNGLWKFVQSKKGSDLFTLRNNTEKTSGKVGSLRFYSSGSRWQAYYLAASGFDNNDNTALKLYIPVKTVYNSNPAAAIIQPTVAFEKGNTTLYLDGTTTYTNAASVTGVSKTINYTSSNTGVATVTSEGVVTAEGIGTATITASVAAELGVNKAASKTYEITVKNTTTIAGLKALYDAAQSPAKAFTADLTDAVVTYVNGNHAYIQDATGAIYASCGSSLTAGKKINGAVGGTITAPNKIDEIKTIDISAATVTEDGVIPAAAVKTLAEIKAGDYDGKLVTVNGATVKTGMDNATSGGVITDDDNVTTFNIIAPNKLTLNATEEGNFTAFVSIYGGSTYRLNIYEASQFVKTRNVATAQPLAFTKDAIELGEETTAFAEFKGQAVEGALGTVTYAITGDAIGTVNAETGVVTLNGACGTATITATAAAKEVTVAGVTTPYTETEESYIVTVNPRYSVTFFVNGIETVLRQSTSGATIAVPTPGDLGDYTFMGWSTSTVAPTDDAPSMTALGATVTPENNNGKYYAVFAQETEGDDENVELYKNTGSTGTDATSGITASGNINTTSSNGNPGNSFGLTSSSNKTATFTNINISTAKSASLNLDYRLAKSGSDYSSLTVTQYDSEDVVLGTPTNITGSDQDYHNSEAISLNKACVKITIVCTPAGSTYNTFVDNVTINVVRPSVSYSDYRTSLTNATVTMTIGPAGFNTWHQPFAAKFIADGDNGKAYYAADVDANQVVNFQQFSENKIPANTGAIIKGEVNAEVSYTILADDVDFSAENLLHGTNTTEIITADDDYYYFISGRTKVSEDPLTYEYGFFVPKSLETGSTFTNNANKAYLQVLKTKFGGATSKGLGMSWTDAETNGITNVNSTYTDGHYYNLAGQRVSEDYKGVVIYNGKKIIKK